MTSDEGRQLAAENAILRARLGGVVVDLVSQNCALKILLADVRTELLTAGWHEDELLRRIKEKLE